MYEDIRKNKIKTGFIVTLFTAVVAFIVYYIGLYFELGIFSVVIALIISSIAAFSSYYNSDKIVLKLNGARPVTEEENNKLVGMVDALLVASGSTFRPKLYIVEDAQANAFATGRNPENSVICVTTGLLDKLEYYELESVLAHELAHIKNYDILLSTVVSVMVGLVVILSDFFTRIAFRSKRSNNKNSSNADILIFLVGLIFVILSPIFAQLVQLAVSRKREYLADATSVSYTRNPDGMINALRKLNSDTNQLKTASKSTENMYIVNPFKSDKNKKKSSLFSTHPSIEDRIVAIEKLK